MDTATVLPFNAIFMISNDNDEDKESNTDNGKGSRNLLLLLWVAVFGKNTFVSPFFSLDVRWTSFFLTSDPPCMTSLLPSW
jgi:hypothetical protein